MLVPLSLHLYYIEVRDSDLGPWVRSDQPWPSEMHAKTGRGCLCVPFSSGRVNSFHQILKDSINAKTLGPIALDQIRYASLDLVSITVFFFRYKD